MILDGVGDLPVTERGNQTPLEAANTPNLDKFAAKGEMGTVYSVKKGIAPESDAGVFSLLSYDPSKLDLSRGVVEALGAGVEFHTGDLALRCNFATVENGQLVDRRAGRNISADEAKQLVEAVNGSSALKELAKFELKATTGHRCALVIRSDGQLSSSISNLDPAYVRKGKVATAVRLTLPAPIPHCAPLSRSGAAIRTAELLNKFATAVHDVLKDHPVNISRKERGDMPANFLLMRDAGTTSPEVASLEEKFGFKAVALVDMPVELGIAKVVGMDTEPFPPHRSLEAYARRAQKATDLARKYGLVYVHLKGPDEPGHDGDFDGKKRSIEDIDAGFFAGIQRLDGSLLCVTADHSTPCVVKGHSDDPVPILVTGLTIRPDGSKRFTEEYARNGKLGTIRHGYEILKLLKKLAR